MSGQLWRHRHTVERFAAKATEPHQNISDTPFHHEHGVLGRVYYASSSIVYTHTDRAAIDGWLPHNPTEGDE